MRTVALLVAALCGATAPVSVAEAEPSCAVRLRAEVARRGAKKLELKVTAENLTRRAVELTLPGPCPSGPIQIDGLPPGFDLYGRCGAACVDERSPPKVRLRPRARTVAATATIAVGERPRGCVPFLPPGRYTLTPVAPALEVPVCVAPTSVDVAGPPAASTPPTSAASGDPYACDSDGDCVLSCPDVPGCCSMSTCGCGHAIRADHVASYAAERKRTCERPPCPAMGCAHEEYSAACVNHRCVGRRGNGLGLGF